MKAKNLNLFLDFLYLFCLYLAVKLLPFEDWFSVAWGKDVAVGVLTTVLIGLSLYEAFRVKKNSCLKKISPLFAIPFLLVCCSNFIYGAFFLEPCVTFAPERFFPSLFSLVMCAILEEILFRYFLLEFFYGLFEGKRQQALLTILLTAVSFALMHVVNFFGNPVGAVFQQIGYTFFLGLIFGFMAIYLNETWLPSLLHVLYNFLNLQLFQTLYDLQDTDYRYILVSVLIGLVFAVYLIPVGYFGIREKEDTKNVS